MRLPVKRITPVICALLFLSAASAGADEFHFLTQAELNRLWGPGPGIRSSAVSAFGNPAYSGIHGPHYLESEWIYALSEGSYSPKYLGGFMNSGSLALGLLYSFLPDDRGQLDLSAGFGFGNRAFSFGFANRSVYSSYESGRDRFFSGYQTGVIARPGRFLSLGVSAGGTYDGAIIDAGGELGIRPLGTSLITLSGAYFRTIRDDAFRNAWSLGLTVNPVPGLIMYGTYHDDRSFSLGLSFIINDMGISGGVLTSGDFSSSNTIIAGLSSVRNTGREFFAGDNGRAYVEISLHGSLDETSSYLREQPSLLDLLRVISKAAGDSEVGGLLLHFDQFSAGREAIWELRSALADFKARGKHIIAITDDAGFDLYYLLSAADRIVLDPQGSIMIPGYAIGRSYFRNTLDKLGIGVRELRYLDYKSSAETYTRSSLSDADREQYGAYLDSVYAIAKNAIMEGRRWTSAEFEDRIGEFLYSARRAKERGLIDSIGRYEDADTIIREFEGRSVMRMDFGKRYHYYDAPDTRWGEPPHIAVIYASGQTDMDRGMEARTIAALIETLSNRPNILAIVLRVNSPGGSALAADHIAEAVRQAKEKIPVVVSMGAVAGSGGYWLSLYGSSILASPYTLTGSIGVIGTWFYDNGLGELLGFNVDALQQGAHADLLTGFILPRRDLTEEEEGRYRSYILDLYDNFVEKVAEGRGLSRKDVEKAAQGRLYGGEDAVRTGLVDRIGGLWDAVQMARNLAGIDDRELIIDEYPRARLVESFGERLFSVLLPRIEALSQTAPLGAALEELRFRLSQNGEVMPLMPLDIIGVHE
ncbi:MAG: signal peptide peptidase SppA [Spirochaetaceae bacterium]|nr:signal peptide peptidase SppA [Spirochaetaceae bacterium]